MEAEGAGNGQTGSDAKPRLVIKRLELENFKSYYGKIHIGPFHKVRMLVTSGRQVVKPSACPQTVATC